MIKREEIQLVLATEKDAEVIHDMQVKVFLPLYEKCRDDETSPARESLGKIVWRFSHSDSEYYLIQFAGKHVGVIRIARRRGRMKKKRNIPGK